MFFDFFFRMYGDFEQKLVMILFHYFRRPLQTECFELSTNNDHLTNTMKVGYLKKKLELSF